ncbi:binding-protein-dependent transport systems inner membrane component [[Clostridium] cellulosi]|uniref:Binding-protein-dependent transport systems inner membrane component n=1 Tax=[Clostridium] cellulosi TaxID=29343 RepID=A0A078KQ16_9FIRM|nr:binding-protein-dependent transport systems inner membrane component [[Clostridium] cellulosi]
MRKKAIAQNIKIIAKDWQLYSLLILPVLYYIIFKYGPMVGNVIAFRKYVQGGPWLGTEWVGLKYFKMFINDAQFWRAFRNTIIISVSTLIFTFPIPIIFALLLNEIKNVAFKKSVQTISYLPHFLSMVVVANMIYDFLSPSTGFLNRIIQFFTGHTIQFMQISGYFVPIYVISAIWQETGWGAILYLAALTNINTELYEAAEIDGAGKFKQAIHVTIPGIMPTIAILFILNLGNLLNVGFEKILLLYNPVIYDTSDVISTYLYRMAFNSNSFSYATAIGLFESIIGLLLVVGANKLTKKITETSLW